MGAIRAPQEIPTWPGDICRDGGRRATAAGEVPRTLRESDRISSICRGPAATVGHLQFAPRCVLCAGACPVLGHSPDPFEWRMPLSAKRCASPDQARARVSPEHAAGTGNISGAGKKYRRRIVTTTALFSVYVAARGASVL